MTPTFKTLHCFSAFFLYSVCYASSDFRNARDLEIEKTVAERNSKPIRTTDSSKIPKIFDGGKLIIDNTPKISFSLHSSDVESKTEEIHVTHNKKSYVFTAGSTKICDEVSLEVIQNSPDFSIMVYTCYPAKKHKLGDHLNQYFIYDKHFQTLFDIPEAPVTSRETKPQLSFKNRVYDLKWLFKDSQGEKQQLRYKFKLKSYKSAECIFTSTEQCPFPNNLQRREK